MRIITTFLIATGLVFTAVAQTTTDTKKPAAKKAVKIADQPTIPPDAVPVGDGSFRYTDKAGKKWIYRNTPFGVSKAEERPVTQPVQRITDEPTKSEDLGDSYRFTRPTPFGPKVWVKKKTDLDSFEKSIVDRDQGKDATPAAQRDSGKSDSPKQD